MASSCPYRLKLFVQLLLLFCIAKAIDAQEKPANEEQGSSVNYKLFENRFFTFTYWDQWEVGSENVNTCSLLYREDNDWTSIDIKAMPDINGAGYTYMIDSSLALLKNRAGTEVHYCVPESLPGSQAHKIRYTLIQRGDTNSCERLFIHLLEKKLYLDIDYKHSRGMIGIEEEIFYIIDSIKVKDDIPEACFRDVPSGLTHVFNTNFSILVPKGWHIEKQTSDLLSLVNADGRHALDIKLRRGEVVFDLSGTRDKGQDHIITEIQKSLIVIE